MGADGPPPGVAQCVQCCRRHAVHPRLPGIVGKGMRARGNARPSRVADTSLACTGCGAGQAHGRLCRAQCVASECTACCHCACTGKEGRSGQTTCRHNAVILDSMLLTCVNDTKFNAATARAAPYARGAHSRCMPQSAQAALHAFIASQHRQSNAWPCCHPARGRKRRTQSTGQPPCARAAATVVRKSCGHLARKTQRAVAQTAACLAIRATTFSLSTNVSQLLSQ